MKAYQGCISKDSLNLFASDIGVGEFFSYVGNLVSLEQAISVLGLLSPDFVEVDGHVFWLPNAQQYDSQKKCLKGLVETEAGALEQSTSRKDVERYRNIFSINQFFSKWEDSPNRPVFKVGLSEEDYRLCHLFAEQIARYWKRALSDCFPEKVFQFEIADDLLDEYGVCLTFWQL
ncbi:MULTISPECIES: hypothetical protein [Pseudomonas]|uniref:Uncharacterized protein n=1 Tax=Pseudomonas soli TaxID=1306993 RepID=A0A2V4H9Y6_9PSED|nr:MULTISPECIES: hypothetical protein [Pseudomonas]MBH3308755.1 hypothetical protein [Pseudomonas mosselii]MBH3326672.1 hypothetical protein [Pseudomonas mosselii]MBS9764265.1 hypothetical protein [Pseudomonas mosselii]MDH1509107.1 hypothetical protein [Pseudomonas mosselii]ODB37311.1 hypothetical protein A9L43_03105 [Pseudomonas mosselii]